MGFESIVYLTCLKYELLEFFGISGVVSEVFILGLVMFTRSYASDTEPSDKKVPLALSRFFIIYYSTYI